MEWKMRKKRRKRDIGTVKSIQRKNQCYFWWREKESAFIDTSSQKSVEIGILWLNRGWTGKEKEEEDNVWFRQSTRRHCMQGTFQIIRDQKVSMHNWEPCRTTVSRIISYLTSFLTHGCDRHMENNNYGLTLTPRRITILSVIFFQLCGVFGGT